MMKGLVILSENVIISPSSPLAVTCVILVPTLVDSRIDILRSPFTTGGKSFSLITVITTSAVPVSEGLPPSTANAKKLCISCVSKSNSLVRVMLPSCAILK